MDFEAIGSNAKDLLKNKKFQIAIVVVGMVALILWIIKQQRTTTTTTETFDSYDGTSPIGYGGYGYPSTSGVEQDFDWLYERLDGLADMITDTNAAQDEKWDEMFGALSDRLDGLGDGSEDNYVSGGYVGGFTSPSQKVDEQAIIDAMEANSNAWWDTTTAEGRDYLHSENAYLGSLIGASYDNQTGIWYKDGLPLYNVNKGNANSTIATTSTGSRQPSSGTVGYVANVDYQAAINEALSNGASAATINQLNEARNAKIAATGGGSTVSYDPNTDYQALINQAKAVGADQSVIDNLTASRNAKIEAMNNGTTATSSGTGCSGSRVNMTR